MLDYDTLENQKQFSGKNLESGRSQANSFKVAVKQLLTLDTKGLNGIDFNWTDGCEDLELRGIQITELTDEVRGIWPIVASGLGQRTYSRRVICYPYDIGEKKTIEAYVNSRKDQTTPIVVYLSQIADQTHNNYFMIFGEDNKVQATKNLIKNLSTQWNYRSKEVIPFRRPL